MIEQPIVKIEKGIPMPRGRGFVNGISKVFAAMNVGDSFQVEASCQQNIYQAISHFKKRIDSKKKFTMRRIDKVKMRCWRVK